MEVVAEWEIGNWRIALVVPSCGGLGIILRGPRGVTYIPPVVRAEEMRVFLPKYLVESIKNLVHVFPEISVNSF